jgi:hypothetical protein
MKIMGGVMSWYKIFARSNGELPIVTTTVCIWTKNKSKHYLNLWHSEVEARQCHFLGNVMFYKSLSHILSLYKHVDRYESLKAEQMKHLHTKSEFGHWATHLDFFLYNNLAHNPVRIDKFLILTILLSNLGQSPSTQIFTSWSYHFSILPHIKFHIMTHTICQYGIAKQERVQHALESHHNTLIL